MLRIHKRCNTNLIEIFTLKTENFIDIGDL